MSGHSLPKNAWSDLEHFILTSYIDCLPNSLLVTQDFKMKYQKYRKEFGPTR